MPRLIPKAIKILFVLVWLLVLNFMSEEPLSVISEYGGFALLGVIGAIFANSTGAGGGVIFVPFFSQLGLDNSTIVATSFGIQCFGMTAGALSWFMWYTHQTASRNIRVANEWRELPGVLLLTIPFSMTGIVLVQQLEWQSPSSLHMTFGAFSVLLALAIFASIPLLKNTEFHTKLDKIDKVCLPFIAFIGGGITAWLSVGVGELIAVYLIFRRYNVSFSIACAVILSAFSVWAGVMFHLFDTGKIYWYIILFAGPGAIIGGTLAKHLVLYFSATKLKLFFASWVLLIGIASIPL